MLSMLLEGISLEVADGFSNPTAACTACTASGWSAVEVGVRGVKSGCGVGPPSDEWCPSLEERASFRLAAAFGSRAFRWWGCLATGVLPPTSPPGARGFPGELAGLCTDGATLLTPATLVCASDCGRGATLSTGGVTEGSVAKGAEGGFAAAVADAAAVAEAVVAAEAAGRAVEAEEAAGRAVTGRGAVAGKGRAWLGMPKRTSWSRNA